MATITPVIHSGLFNQIKPQYKNSWVGLTRNKYLDILNSYKASGIQKWDKYDLIAECMTLHCSQVITSEQYISITKMIMSEDDENFHVAQQIVNNFKNNVTNVHESSGATDDVKI